MRLVAVVDDEVSTREFLAGEIRRQTTGVRVFPVQSQLELLDVLGGGTSLTRALVDLSYGVFDRTGAPIGHTGVDVIDTLMATTQSCQVAVVSRFDGDPLMPEMVTAIRQTWPDIRFLHKADQRLAEWSVRFINGEVLRDNAVFAPTLAGLAQVPPDALRHLILSSEKGSTSARVLLYLAEQVERPTAGLAAHALGVSEQYVRTVLQWLGVALRSADLMTEDEEAGVARFWLFARARRAILTRALR